MPHVFTSNISVFPHVSRKSPLFPPFPFHFPLTYPLFSSHFPFAPPSSLQYGLDQGLLHRLPSAVLQAVPMPPPSITISVLGSELRHDTHKEVGEGEGEGEGAWKVFNMVQSSLLGT